MPSDWKVLANKGKKFGLKYGKEGLKFAKQAAAESGLLGSYTIGGKEVVELKKLASGGFGSVKLVRDVNTNDEYALKKVRCVQGKSQVACTNEEAEREARLISRISHPNIVKCIAWGRRECSKKGVTEILMMLELCSEGNLADYLHKHKGILRPKDIVDCLFDITDSIHFLHNWQRIPLCHRDIKIENILKHKNGAWKICDFGSMCCRNVIYPKELSKKGVMDLQDEIDKKVTMLYRPPEMVDLQFSRDDRENDWPIGTAVDMWMLGCVTYCLLFGQHPFHDSATAMAIRNAKYYLPRTHPNMSMKNTMLLAQWLMSPRPEDRPDTEKLLALLETWREQPDLFDQLPPETQERLQKTWNLYGLKFSSKDNSSEGVYKKSRFKFVPKNDDLMKKGSLPDRKPERPDDQVDQKEADSEQTIMPNLMEFDDSPPQVIITNKDVPASCGDLLGFDDDTTPVGAIGESPPSDAFDPFNESGQSGFDDFVAAVPPFASEFDPFGAPAPSDPFAPAQPSDPFGAPGRPSGGVSSADPFSAPDHPSSGVPFGVSAARPSGGVLPFGAPARPSGDPFAPAQPSGDPFAPAQPSGDPFASMQPSGGAVSSGDPFGAPDRPSGGVPFGVSALSADPFGAPERPSVSVVPFAALSMPSSGGDPFGGPIAPTSDSVDPFSFTAAPVPVLPVPTQGAPFLAPSASATSAPVQDLLDF